MIFLFCMVKTKFKRLLSRKVLIPNNYSICRPLKPALWCLFVALTQLGPSQANEPTAPKKITMESWGDKCEFTYLHPAENYTTDIPDFTPSWDCAHKPSWIGNNEYFTRSKDDLKITKMSDTEFPLHIFYHFCRFRRFTLTNQHLNMPTI